MEPNLDDKGKGTPAGDVPETKPAEVTLEQLLKDFDSLKKDHEDVKKRLTDKETQSQQLTEEIRVLRSKKDPLIAPPPYQQPIKKDDDDGDDDDFDTKYQAKRLTEKRDEYTKLANFCFERFTSDTNVEWNESIDAQFRKRVSKTHLGDTEGEIMDSLKFIYNGIVPPTSKQPEKKEEDKPVSLDLGDGGNNTVKRDVSGKTNWSTKKLNKFEQAAADYFPTGEKGYRKKMQQLEDSRN